MFSKKKILKKIFLTISTKKVFRIFFSGKKGLPKFSERFLALSNKILTVQKIVLSSSRGQGNFRGLEASRPRTSKSVPEAKDVLENSTSGNMEWKTFSMEWTKIASIEYGQIVFHFMPCPVDNTCQIK